MISPNDIVIELPIALRTNFSTADHNDEINKRQAGSPTEEDATPISYAETKTHIKKSVGQRAYKTVKVLKKNKPQSLSLAEDENVRRTSSLQPKDSTSDYSVGQSDNIKLYIE